MAAITDLGDLINLATGGNSGTPENLFFFKNTRVAGAAAASTIAGRGTSLWQYDGSYGAGAAPTTGAIPTRSTAGAIPFTAPGGSRSKYLIQAGATSSVVGTLLIYDRLYHIGNLSGTSIVDQTVQGSPASPALTRNTGGVGNMAFYEIYTQIGTTSTTLTMTYTDDAGNASQTTTVNIGTTGFREAQRMQRIPLASGDKGIQAIEKVRLTATTGTAGNFGIIIARPIAYIPLSAAGMLGMRDYTTGLPGIPTVDSDACLAMMFIPTSTTGPELFGAFSFVEK
jgi:hypothetical protein